MGRPLGSRNRGSQGGDIAYCACHGELAYLEEDHKLPFWVCQIDDKVCDVVFDKEEK